MEISSATTTEKRIALFFFFVFLDDRIAARATARALDHLKKQLKIPPTSAVVATDLQIVTTVMKVYRQAARSFALTQIHPSAEAWRIPKNLDMGPWRQFRKQVDIEDVITVIWSQILNFKSPDIAAGMEVSEGTVLYRLAAGLKFLGTMAPLGGLRA